MTTRPAFHFRKSSDFDVSVEELWSFHMRPEALTLLTPPLSGFRVVDRGMGVSEGSILTAEVGLWPLAGRWVALHSGVEELRSFTDTALESPFPYWVHIHEFERLDAERSRLTDSVWFLPPRWMGRTVGRALVTLMLQMMFAWRHRATRRFTRLPPGVQLDMGNPEAPFGQEAHGGPS